MLKVKREDVIRFNKGSAALMKVMTQDDHCGYTTYHGVHLYGEPISIAHSDRVQLADKADRATWKLHEGDRIRWTQSITGCWDKGATA